MAVANEVTLLKNDKNHKQTLKQCAGISQVHSLTICCVLVEERKQNPLSPPQATSNSKSENG